MKLISLVAAVMLATLLTVSFPVVGSDLAPIPNLKDPEMEKRCAAEGDDVVERSVVCMKYALFKLQTECLYFEKRLKGLFHYGNLLRIEKEVEGKEVTDEEVNKEAEKFFGYSSAQADRMSAIWLRYTDHGLCKTSEE